VKREGRRNVGVVQKGQTTTLCEIAGNKEKGERRRRR
jgi:hypothetical protein